jgi:hypothetical protein
MNHDHRKLAAGLRRAAQLFGLVIDSQSDNRIELPAEADLSRAKHTAERAADVFENLEKGK